MRKYIIRRVKKELLVDVCLDCQDFISAVSRHFCNKKCPVDELLDYYRTKKKHK